VRPTIKEEDRIIFEDYAELSWKETDEEYIELYLKGEFIGRIRVWIDRHPCSVDPREYICVNDEILYLNDLKQVDELSEAEI